jgi:hypothetical protein
MWRWGEWWRDAIEGEGGLYNSRHGLSRWPRRHSHLASLLRSRKSRHDSATSDISLIASKVDILSSDIATNYKVQPETLTIQTILPLDTAIISDGTGIRGQAGSELKAQLMQAVLHMATLCDVVASGQTDA